MTVLYCNCTVTVLQPYCNCIATVLQLYCTATVLQMYCNCTTIVIQLYWSKCGRNVHFSKDEVHSVRRHLWTQVCTTSVTTCSTYLGFEALRGEPGGRDLRVGKNTSRSQTSVLGPASRIPDLARSRKFLPDPEFSQKFHPWFVCWTRWSYPAVVPHMKEPP